jgi:DNA-binding NarL/FixJ family response regulator
MIRVACIDSHPAVTSGLEAILREQVDLAPVGVAEGDHALWPLLHRTRPDVVVLDRVVLCLLIKARPLAPKVVVYGDAGPVAAALAGADGLVDKTAPVGELLRVVRSVAAGRREVPRITRALQVQAAERLSPDDRAIFAMRLAGTRTSDIARAIGMSLREVRGRSHAMVAAL